MERPPESVVVAIEWPGPGPRCAALADVLVTRADHRELQAIATDLFHRYPGLMYIMVIDPDAGALALASRGVAWWIIPLVPGRPLAHLRGLALPEARSQPPGRPAGRGR